MHNNTQNGSLPVTIKIVFATLLAFFIVFFTWPALAQVYELESKWTCGETQALGKELQKVGEQIVGAGKMDGVVTMTLWVNTTTLTWTVVATPDVRPDTSCIVITGDNFKVFSITPNVSI